MDDTSPRSTDPRADPTDPTDAAEPDEPDEPYDDGPTTNPRPLGLNSRPWRHRHRSSSPLQSALNREWRDRFARGLVDAPASWRDDPRLSCYRLVGEPLAEMCAAGVSAQRADEIAEALAVAAAAGDEVATRVMVQRMLPNLVVIAWGGGFGSGASTGEEADTLDTMISTVWLSLATGDALRGESGVWRRLVRDAEYLVLQRPRRRRAREDQVAARLAVTACAVADITGRPDGSSPPAAEELLEVVGEALTHGLRSSDAHLLAMLGVAGVPVTEVAETDPARVTSRCIRYRRAAALRRVRSLATEAA